MITKNRVLDFIANRRYIVTAIAALTAIGFIIIGILLLHNSRQILSTNTAAQLTDHQINQIRLEIFKLCVVMLLIAGAGAVSIMLCLKAKLEYIYLVAALSLGMAYMFVMTPLAVPDEGHHYQSAHELSGYLLFDGNPRMADRRYFDYSSFSHFHNVPSAYIRFMDEGIYILRGEAEVIDIPLSYRNDFPLWNIPQALGVTIARIIGLSFFGAFYLGRLFNLVFYTLCMTFSIKHLKAFKLPVFLIGLMPMNLHQAASFSYDAFIHGAAIVFFAYAVSGIYERDSFRWREFSLLLVFGALLAPAKVVYFPVIFMVFIVAWRWKETAGNKAWILAAAIFSAAAASTLLFTMAHIARDFVGENINTWTGEHNYTLSFVLGNPVETMGIFMRTLINNSAFYMNTMFGGVLAGLTISMPKWITITTVILIIISIIYGKKDEWQPSGKERFYYFMICASVIFLVLLTSFIGWTTHGLTEVAGIQGRYFIPVLPLALLVLRFKKVLISHEAFRNAVIGVFLVMQGAAILYILNLTIGLYG
jgi:uncharacterized membrane protein